MEVVVAGLAVVVATVAIDAAVVAEHGSWGRQQSPDEQHSNREYALHRFLHFAIASREKRLVGQGRRVAAMLGPSTSPPPLVRPGGRHDGSSTRGAIQTRSVETASITATTRRSRSTVSNNERQVRLTDFPALFFRMNTYQANLIGVLGLLAGWALGRYAPTWEQVSALIACCAPLAVRLGTTKPWKGVRGVLRPIES